MKKSKILFRADGNKKIGMGHVVRCTALADMLKNDFYIVFAVIEPSDFVQAQIMSVSDEIKIIQSENDIWQLLEGIDIVVLDGYQYTTEYMQQLINSKVKLVYIDDIQNMFYPAHIIINHNPGAKPDKYKVASYTKLLMGFDYALLRKSFLEKSRYDLQQVKGINKLLITMGGADPLNIIAKILPVLSEMDFEIKVIAPVSVNTNAETFTNVSWLSNLSAEEMSETMQQADIILCPSSSVCMEAIAVNVPILCGFYTDNQKQFYDFLVSENIVYGIGDFQKIGKEDFSAQIKDYCISNHSSRHKYIDGRQPERFVHEFKLLASA